MGCICLLTPCMSCVLCLRTVQIENVMEAMGACISSLAPDAMAAKFGMFVMPMVMAVQGIVAEGRTHVTSATAFQLAMYMDHLVSLTTATNAPVGVVHPIIPALADVRVHEVLRLRARTVLMCSLYDDITVSVYDSCSRFLPTSNTYLVPYVTVYICMLTLSVEWCCRCAAQASLQMWPMLDAIGTMYRDHANTIEQLCKFHRRWTRVSAQNGGESQVRSRQYHCPLGHYNLPDTQSPAELLVSQDNTSSTITSL